MNSKLVFIIIFLIVVIVPPILYLTPMPNKKCSSTQLDEIEIIASSQNYFLFRDKIESSLVKEINVPVGECFILEFTLKGDLYVNSVNIIFQYPKVQISLDNGASKAQYMYPPNRLTVYNISITGDGGRSSQLQINVQYPEGYWNTKIVNLSIYFIIVFSLEISLVIGISRYTKKKKQHWLDVYTGRKYIKVNPDDYNKLLDVLSKFTPDAPVNLLRIAELANLDKDLTEYLILDLLKFHYDLGEYKSLEQVFYRLKTKPEVVERGMVNTVQSMLEQRRCCILSGRMGDGFCNICGRSIPEEYQVSRSSV